MTPPVPSAPTPAMRVLAWPAEANEELNPYNALLALHLRRLGVEVEEWSWQRLWTRSYDLLHLHWPDLLLQTPSGTRAAINAACLLLNLAVCRARGIKIVWTAHNLGSHEQLHPGMERCLWWSFTRLIDGYISLSATGKEALCRRFPALRPRPGFVIPHGNYQPSYPCSVEPAEARRRLGVAPDATVLGFFGRVRHDKNVPELVRAFRQLTRDDLVLLVAGEPEPAELGATVEHAAAADPRVRLRLEHIPPDEIQLVLGACDLVVLPYRSILNSGSALLALSFACPVLVPNLGSLGELQRLVGEEYVRVYSGPISATVLDDALAWLATVPRVRPPDLRHTAWEGIAELTLAAYGTLTGR